MIEMKVTGMNFDVIQDEYGKIKVALFAEDENGSSDRALLVTDNYEQLVRAAQALNFETVKGTLRTTGLNFNDSEEVTGKNENTVRTPEGYFKTTNQFGEWSISKMNPAYHLTGGGAD
ncbi:hypothetical protein A2p39 [Lactobacillus phage A2]|uniref:Uncharacterized protein n=2 Tax=root TaxID=1 RepID=Q9T0Y0_9CAUD|nr:hypothetical protein A2p39 [Lactobacillus phage A2]CAB63673.1 hypothetical protein [Lactobacillus phage A2]